MAAIYISVVLICVTGLGKKGLKWLACLAYGYNCVIWHRGEWGTMCHPLI